MLILIDHANVDAIAKTLEYLPIDGVTTNPTILYREGKEPLEVLHAIKSVLPDGAQLHVQIVSQRADDMVAEARALRRRNPAATSSSSFPSRAKASRPSRASCAKACR